MKLMNQNNPNLISAVSNFARELSKTGKSPEQLFNEVASSGKYSKNEIEQAKQKAQSIMHLFSH